MKTSPSRLLPIALSAVLVLGACGGDDGTGDGPIDSVDGQTGLRAPTPIQVTGGGDATGNLAAAAGEDAPASGAATGEMMIAPAYWVSEYVAGDGLVLPVEDTGYVFDATVPVSAEQVAELASVLGVDGEPVHLVEDYGNSWRVGSDDGSGPSLWVSEDGQQSWNYNGAWLERDAVMGCAVSVDSDGNESSDCPEPEPPVGVPAAAEAEQRSRDLLIELGEDVSALTAESYGDEWFASVTFRDAGDDRVALREWNFGYGAEGVLQHAGGWLAQAQPVGPYPLIDLNTALARLNDQNYWFGAGGGGMIEPDIATAEAPPIDAAVESGVAVEAEIAVGMPESEVVEGEGSSAGSTGGADASTDAVIVDEPIPVEPDGGIGDGAEPLPSEPDAPEPMPVEPMPEPEPVVMTLVDVQADLWWAWDIDGSVWLLPAYRFIDTEGGWHTVPAVTDEFMIQTEPPVFVGEPEPMPAPEPVPGEPAPEPDAPEPIEEVPGTPDPEAIIVSLNEILPVSLDEFTALAAERGFSTRVVMQDGEGLAVTADYSQSRVNVAVEGDTVVAVQSVG